MITAFVPFRARENRLAALGEAIAELPGVAEACFVAQGIPASEGMERTETRLASRAYPRRRLDQGFALGEG